MPVQLKTGRGFTLLELLVVIIIIGVLASVALPQFGRAIDRAREAEAINVAGALLNAEYVYFQESGKFTTVTTELVVGVPTMKDWATPTFALTGDTGVKITIESIQTGSHKHDAAADHKVEASVDKNSKKDISWTRK